MRTILLEVTPGNDVVQSIIGFARRGGGHASVTVLSATGMVDRVVLQNEIHGAFRRWDDQGSSYVPMPGDYTLVSLPGYVAPLPGGDFSSAFTAILVDQTGGVYGGVVNGWVVASGTVVVVLSICENPVVAIGETPRLAAL